MGRVGGVRRGGREGGCLGCWDEGMRDDISRIYFGYRDLVGLIGMIAEKVNKLGLVVVVVS